MDMKDFADLIRAIATLLWPVLGFFIVLYFQPQIVDLLARIKKGKLLGQEIELADTLEQLQRTVVAVEKEVDAAHKSEANFAQEKGSDDRITYILHETARSPRVGLVILATELEKEMRDLAASVGLVRGRRPMPVPYLLRELDQHYQLPKNVISAFKLFWDIRNKIVHAKSASEEDILRAVDSGMTLLKALEAIPREINTVFHPGVEIYSDSECSKHIENTKGVILETLSPGGTMRSIRIFPTTMTHFEKGKRVAWEWNNERQWGAAWYRDPETSEITSAWHSSFEFIGHNLDE